jgi:hypothetical protein
MIIIKIVSGPHAGKSRRIQNGKYRGTEISPVALLDQLFQIGSRWEIDYRRATADEALEWGRADLMMRIVRALMEKRSVTFLGTAYRVNSSDEVPAIAQQVEDAISTSGFNVTVEHDDETGVLIGTLGTEHRVQ